MHQIADIRIVTKILGVLNIADSIREANLVVARYSTNLLPLWRLILADQNLVVIELLVQDGVQQRGQMMCPVVGRNTDSEKLSIIHGSESPCA